ncbi:MAG: hypothetical protein AAGC77_09790 [Pseudomonadota bacterium]
MEQAEVLNQLQQDLSSNNSAIMVFLTFLNAFLFVTIVAALGRASGALNEARRLETSVLEAATALAPDYGSSGAKSAIRSLHKPKRAKPMRADRAALPGGRHVSRKPR